MTLKILVQNGKIIVESHESRKRRDYLGQQGTRKKDLLKSFGSSKATKQLSFCEE